MSINYSSRILPMVENLKLGARAERFWGLLQKSPIADLWAEIFGLGFLYMLSITEPRAKYALSGKRRAKVS